MKEKAKILVVDDEIEVLETIKDVLGEDKYCVETETNPQKALEHIKKEAFDLVITDIMMPEVSGVDIVKAVKLTGRDTMVVVMTAFASVETAIKSIQFGVYDYVQKPIVNIKIIVERAIEKLSLQRKNKELKQKIEEMLAKISLLHDISAILYQVSDFNEAAQMILDTLAEGLKIKRVAILLEQEETSRYTIVKTRELNSSIVDQFKFKRTDQINNQPLSFSNVTVLNDLNGKINIANSQLTIDKGIKKCIIVPINFHTELLGYMVVFLNEAEVNESENIVKLLKIFSNQIAPILHSSLKEGERVSIAENQVTKIIENNIVQAKSSLSPISFAIIRIVILQTPDEVSLLNDYLSVAKNMMSRQINNRGEIRWLTMDTALIIHPASDLFTIEKLCINLVKNVEKLQIAGNKEAILTLKYSCVSYPQMANTSSALTHIMWKNLFEEMEKIQNPQ